MVSTDFYLGEREQVLKFPCTDTRLHHPLLLNEVDDYILLRFAFEQTSIVLIISLAGDIQITTGSGNGHAVYRFFPDDFPLRFFTTLTP